MPRTSSLPRGSPGGSSSNGRRQRQRASLRVRNVADGVVYHLVFEGDIRRLSGRQLRHHLAQICHISPSEQHLVVHGSAFPVTALGADVGLVQDDTVELYYGESAGAAHGHHQRREASAATASSLRPSTDAGTMSPAPPEDERERGGHYARTHTARYEEARGGGDGGAATRRVPPSIKRPGADARASVTSTATSNSRCVAPSPDRLVERHGPLRPQEQQQQQRRDEYWGAVHDDSQLPPSTAATTMSSLYTGRYGGVGGEASPHPHAPLSSAHPRGQHQQRQQQRPSYEVPSPYERRQPRQRDNESYMNGAPEDAVAASSYHYDAAGASRSSGVNGLNHSRREPVYDGSRSRRSGGLTNPSHLYEGSAEPHRSLVATAAAYPATERTIPIRADDLEALLDEQDYIWRMEDYRFRTERLNRLSALQNRQRELAFEAARYDQAVAVVASQLSRERRKLAELQEAMTHHSASLGGLDGYAVPMRRGKVAAVEEEDGDYEDGEEEVIEVGM